MLSGEANKVNIWPEVSPHVRIIRSRLRLPVVRQIGVGGARGIDFAAIPGPWRGGIDGHLYQLGNHRLVEELGLCSPDIENAGRTRAPGKDGSAYWWIRTVSSRSSLLPIRCARRAVRPSPICIHGVQTLMLTGDNAHTAEAIARAVGIDEGRGNLLPGQTQRHRIITTYALQPALRHQQWSVTRHQRRAELARADIGFRHGAAGNGHRDRESRRRSADGRRPTQNSDLCPAVAHHFPRADPEHRGGTAS